MQPQDTDILDRIAAGDVNAYAVLVERYQDKAYSLAAGMLADDTEASEAVQDAFVRAFRALPGFNRDAAFSTWLYRIVYNQCLTRIARRKKHRERTTELPPNDMMAGGAPLPGSDLEEQELRRIVQQEIGRLPDNYRTILVLFLVEEHSYQEIADMTDLPLGTIKTRLHRARALLRSNVLSYYDTISLKAESKASTNGYTI